MKYVLLFLIVLVVFKMIYDVGYWQGGIDTCNTLLDVTDKELEKLKKEIDEELKKAKKCENLQDGTQINRKNRW